MTTKRIPKAANRAQKAYLDPKHSLGYLTRINFRAFSRALEKHTAAHGVSAGQWRFLRVLWEEDDITQRQLSDRVGIKEATTARAVGALVKGGLIRRVPSTEDKRKVRILLTPKASRLRDKLIPMVIEVNERAMRGLSQEEIETTRRVLEHTYANLTEESEHA